jgi:hypothetical protein
VLRTAILQSLVLLGKIIALRFFSRRDAESAEKTKKKCPLCALCASARGMVWLRLRRATCFVVIIPLAVQVSPSQSKLVKASQSIIVPGFSCIGVWPGQYRMRAPARDAIRFPLSAFCFLLFLGCSSAFQDGDRCGVLLRVAEADVKGPSAPLGKQRLPLPMKHDVGLSGFLPAYFHVVPSQLRADACAERLGDRFLGREPRRQKRPGRFVRKTIRQFGRMQDSLDESFAEFSVGRFDAVHFDNVDADAENQFESIIKLTDT